MFGTEILHASQAHSEVVRIAFIETDIASLIDVDEQTLCRADVDDSATLDRILVHRAVVLSCVLWLDERRFAFGQLSEPTLMSDNQLEIWNCSHIALSNFRSAPVVSEREGEFHSTTEYRSRNVSLVSRLGAERDGREMSGDEVVVHLERAELTQVAKLRTLGCLRVLHPVLLLLELEEQIDLHVRSDFTLSDFVRES